MTSLGATVLSGLIVSTMLYIWAIFLPKEGSWAQKASLWLISKVGLGWTATITTIAWIWILVLIQTTLVSLLTGDSI